MHRIGSENSAQSPCSSVSQRWYLLLLPYLVAAFVLHQSPNFRFDQTVRSEPLGSDFLQEWTGARIVGSDQASRLYERDFAAELQHDHLQTGFQFTGEGYYPMVYPPFYYFLLRPLAVLPYAEACCLWLMLLATCWSATIWVIARWFTPLQNKLVPLLLASALFSPLFVSLTMAHKSLILLLLFVASYVALHRDRPLLAGCIWGLVAFKPHLGLGVGICMLLQRRWRFAAGAALSVGALICLPLLLEPQLYANLYIQYVVQCATDVTQYADNGGYRLADSHCLWAALRLFQQTFGITLPSWVGSLVAVAVGWSIWRISRPIAATNTAQFGSQFSAWVVASVLLSPHFYFYDLTILLLPLMILGVMAWPGKGQAFEPSETAAGGRIGTVAVGKWWIPKRAQRRRLGQLTVAMLLGAGALTTVAEWSGIQFSLCWGGLVLWQLGNLRPRSPVRRPRRASVAWPGSLAT